MVPCSTDATSFSVIVIILIPPQLRRQRLLQNRQNSPHSFHHYLRVRVVVLLLFIDSATLVWVFRSLIVNSCGHTSSLTTVQSRMMSKRLNKIHSLSHEHSYEALKEKTTIHGGLQRWRIINIHEMHNSLFFQNSNNIHSNSGEMLLVFTIQKLQPNIIPFFARNNSNKWQDFRN